MDATRNCSIDACDRPSKARGLCGPHYSEWHRSASTKAKLGPTRSERFWVKVDRSAGPHACWPWRGSTNEHGYGIFHDGTRNVRAHRYALLTEFGVAPSGDVDHTCHNASGCPGGSSCQHRACCNPAHLEDVPHIENVRRGEAGKHKSTAWKTECVHGHAYTPENQYIDGRGNQRCRTCAHNRYLNRKAAA